MKEEHNKLNREDCIKAINDIMSKTRKLWILQIIYDFSVGMTREEEGGAE